MKVAIIGYGTEGKSTAKYWLKQGHEVTICDRDEKVEVEPGLRSKLGSNYLDDLDQFNLIVRSPGTSPFLIKTTKPVTSGTSEFLEKSPAKVIGITGTKGKSTTASLTAAILEAAGKKAWLAGNIGNSPLDFLDEVKPEDVVVLELSSFQLMDVKLSPQVAVCLMVVPEHLDYHADFGEYTAAKGMIFHMQKPGDLAVYNASNTVSRELAELSAGSKLPYTKPPGAYVKNGDFYFGEQKIASTSTLHLTGDHNLDNACAAITATWNLIDGDVQAVTEALANFHALPHRLQKVAEFGGITYVDDSIATTPEASAAAINSFKQPIILIAGGSDKKVDFSEWAKAVKDSAVKQVIAIGQTAEQLMQVFDEAGFKDYQKGPDTMVEMVNLASKLAESGDIVLLSPGCASFGLFQNAYDRGDQFKKAVLNLKE